MPFPAVLSIEKYMQNLLIVMSNREELHQFFEIAQKVDYDRLDGFRQRRRNVLRSRRILDGIGPKTVTILLIVKSPNTVKCGYIESVVDSEAPDLSKAIFLLLLSLLTRRNTQILIHLLYRANDNFSNTLQTFH